VTWGGEERDNNMLIQLLPGRIPKLFQDVIFRVVFNKDMSMREVLEMAYFAE